MEYRGKEKINDQSTERGYYLDDTFSSTADMMNFDASSGFCSGINDLLSPFFMMSPINVMSTSLSPTFGNHLNSGIAEESGGILGAPLQCGNELVFHEADSHLPLGTNSIDDELESIEKFRSGHGNLSGYMGKSFISRPLKLSLAEKLLGALHLFKEESGGGILAQVWLPLKKGDQCILSTYEQPYLLDETFSGYREISRSFTFSAESRPGCFPGLPGRVYSTKILEWTSNLLYYNKAEYLRLQYAADYEIRGSIALPILEVDSDDASCCAVLELVTRKEKSNFESEIENICRALQSVNLRSIMPPRLYLQNLSKGQRAALSDIVDVLRSVCHVHQLPLALTWIPCIRTEEPSDEIIKIQPRGSHNAVTGKCVLCIEDTASYVNDKSMKGFVHACLGHYLEEGQGVVGKALKSTHPFFYPDVKKYHISEYPLVHHARKFGLNAAVAIQLRSTYSENDDYILEFFLPVTVTDSAEQQLLLNNLSTTMQKLCTTLRTVSDTELLHRSASSIQSPVDQEGGIALQSKSSHTLVSGQMDYRNCLSELPTFDAKEVGPSLQGTGSSKQFGKKRSTAEKHVSLSVLQQYFSGSLKDAAKSIGVCPTTLKRICREYGIARWPSRKINKVNRSLRKLQGVLDSVQCVKSGLKFNSTMGVLSTGSFGQESDSGKSVMLPNADCFTGESGSMFEDGKPASIPSLDIENSTVRVEERCHVRNADESVGAHVMDADQSWAPNLSSEQWMPTLNNSSRNPKPSSGQPYSLMVHEDMDAQPESDGEVNGDQQMISSNRPGSGSMMDGSSSSSKNSEKYTHGSRITVKSSYKEDTIRFKFDPDTGYGDLYEIIAKRFQLQLGQFQLKYLDDEEEWIILANDSDMRECLEVLHFQGARHLTIAVCDAGTSRASN